MNRFLQPFLTFVFLCMALSLPMNADEKAEPKFKVLPSGRVLIDGAVYSSSQKDLFKNGMAIPEARLGAKLWYGNWSSWIDVGIAYGKIGLRNMWIQYDFNPHHSVRVGNFLQPFGYQGPTTANNKPTFEQPLASALFTPGLQLGVMYAFQNPSFYSGTSFHVESSALTNVMNYPTFNQQGYSLITRFVWRNKKAGIDGNPIFNVGVSFDFSSPDRHLIDDEDVHTGFTNIGNFPTKVTPREAVGVIVGDAKNRFKFSPELVVAYKRLALESQYFYQSIDRKNHLPSYTAQGAYVNLRGMILGGNYGYDATIAHLTHPKKHALECVLDYNYATLSDSHSGIYGGRANSFNATLNYYFNAYITARLNYSYTHVWDRAGYVPETLNAVQLRLMVLF